MCPMSAINLLLFGSSVTIIHLKQFSFVLVVYASLLELMQKINRTRSCGPNYFKFCGTRLSSSLTYCRILNLSKSSAILSSSEGDQNISPKIPQPFPVAHTQIVEHVLLLNLKISAMLVLT